MTPSCLTNAARPAAVPLALFLMLALPRQSAHADGSITYKYEDYDEAGGRVGVRTQGILIDQALGAGIQFSATLVDDAIAGASPTGAPAATASGQVPLQHLADHRKAWETDLARRFGRTDLSAGIAQSREHDYISRGWSLNTLTDFNRKNTTLLAGIAGHDDDVETFYDPQHLYVSKHAFSAITGVTQLLDKWTSVTLNFTWGRETGFLNDQYKLVVKSLELLPGVFLPLGYPENRPNERNTGAAYASINRAFPAAHGAVEASYRFYDDTYGIVANTVELRWLQKIGDHFTLAPELRLYEQGAADFYYYDLDVTSIEPTHVPNPGGPAYSSDYRLSSLDSVTYGIKATWKPNDRLEFVAAFDRYSMRGRDGVTPQSAYPVANIVSVGAKVSW